jgi:hypothetical protein
MLKMLVIDTSEILDEKTSIRTMNIAKLCDVIKCYKNANKL